MNNSDMHARPEPKDSITIITGDLRAGTRLETSFCTIYNAAEQVGRLHSIIIDVREQRDALLTALREAEDFISGFEDDEVQEGINDKLGRIRAAIAKAEGKT